MRHRETSDPRYAGSQGFRVEQSASNPMRISTGAEVSEYTCRTCAVSEARKIPPFWCRFGYRRRYTLRRTDDTKLCWIAKSLETR